MTVAGTPPQAPEGVAPIGPPPSTTAGIAAIGSGTRALPQPSGWAVLAPWRVAIYDRAARLQAALDRLPNPTGSDYQAVVASIAEALMAARYLPVAVSFTGRVRHALAGLLGSGNQADRAWMAIHRGEEALVMIADLATLRAEALRIFPAAFKMGSADPMSLIYLELLGRLVAPLKLPTSLLTHSVAGPDDGAVAPRDGTVVPPSGPPSASVGEPPQRGGTMSPS